VDNFLTTCFNFDNEDERDSDSGTTTAAYLDLTNYDPLHASAAASLPSKSFVYPSAMALTQVHPPMAALK